MRVTTFNRQLWGISSFESIGYDKEKKLCVVYFLDGSSLEFSEVEEVVVFQFIIAKEKEDFIQKVFLPNYPFIHRDYNYSESS